MIAGGKAVNAVGGSQAFVAASRVAWLFTNEFEQAEGSNERIPTGRVLVTQAKNNLGRAKGIAYRICSRTIYTNIGEVDASYVGVEQGYVEITADQALAGPQPEKRLGLSMMDRAKAFLQRELANGPVDQRTLMQRAEHATLTEKTLQRAAAELGITKSKVGFNGGWVWGYAPSDAMASLFPPDEG